VAYLTDEGCGVVGQDGRGALPGRRRRLREALHPLSSNLHPAGFDVLLPKTIANATVDRLLHHAHLVITTGDSIRLTQATAGKGVTPLVWTLGQNSWPRPGSSVGRHREQPMAAPGAIPLTVDADGQDRVQPVIRPTDRSEVCIAVQSKMSPQQMRQPATEQKVLGAVDEPRPSLPAPRSTWMMWWNTDASKV
jgi:hypothetical protein